MAKTWSEISSSADFQQETPEAQQEIANQFFEKVIAPDVIANGDDLESIRSEFNSKALSNTSTGIATSIDNQLADVATRLQSMGAAGKLRDTASPNTYTAYGTAPQGVQAPTYQGAGTQQEQQEFLAKAALPYMDEAKKLLGQEQYRGMTQPQIASQLERANNAGNAAEGAVAIATLPVTGGASILGRLATAGAIGAGGSAANQAVESTLSGQNKIDTTKLAESAAFGVGGQGIAEGIAKAAAPLLTKYLPSVFGGASDDAIDELAKAKTTYEERKAVNKIAELGPNEDYLKAVYAGGLKDQQAIMQSAIKDADGNPIVTPRQLLPGNNLTSRYIRSAEERGYGAGGKNDYSRSYDAQESAAPLLNANKEINELSFTGNTPNDTGNAVQDTLQSAADRTRAEISNSYTTAKKSAQTILDQQRIKTIKLPETKQVINTHLSNNSSLGDNVLSDSTKKLLSDFRKAKIKNIDDLDSWKRTLSEQSSKDYRAGDFESNRAVRSVLDSMRTEADGVIQRIDPNAGSLYKESDELYSQITPGYGKGSPLHRVINRDNPDTAANSLLSNSQNGRYNTEQVSGALGQSVNRADAKVANSQRVRSNMDIDELMKSGDNADDAIKEAMRERAIAQGSLEDFNTNLANEVRNRAIAAGSTGDNFNYRQYANSIARNQPSVIEADTAAIASRQAGSDLVQNFSQAQTNESLGNLAKVLASAQRSGRPTQNLVDSSTGLALVADTMGSMGIASVVNFARKFLFDTGALEKWTRMGDTGRFYIDVMSNPYYAGEILKAMGGEKVVAKLQTPLKFEQAIDKMFGNIVNSPVQKVLSRAAIIENNDDSTDKANPSLNRVLQNDSRILNQVPQSEPVQPEPSKTTHRQDIEALYNGFKNAETGGLKDPWIRTMARDKSGAGESSAFGPSQITGTLVKDMLKRYPEQFTDKEKEYMNLMIDQAKLMLANPDDSTYGYGRKGVLGDTKAFRDTYEDVAKKFIKILYEEQGEDYNKLIRRWRGLDDQAYSNKVVSGINAYLDNNSNNQVG